MSAVAAIQRPWSCTIIVVFETETGWLSEEEVKEEEDEEEKEEEEEEEEAIEAEYIGIQ